MSYGLRALAMLGLVTACALALGVGTIIAFALESWLAKRRLTAP